MPPPMIVCRSVKDYPRTGEEVPADHHVGACGSCGEPVALSPSGARLFPAFIVCTECGLKIVHAHQGRMTIAMSEFALSQIERSPTAKRTLDLFLNLTKDKNRE